MTGSRIDILHGRFSELAAVGGVGSVGVGTAVDGGAGGWEILPPSALGELESEKFECKIFPRETKYDKGCVLQPPASSRNLIPFFGVA